MIGTDLAGLVEGILALHQPGGSWTGLGHPLPMKCCGVEWPCPTVRLVAEVTGSPAPEPRLTPGTVRWWHHDVCGCGAGPSDEPRPDDGLVDAARGVSLEVDG